MMVAKADVVVIGAGPAGASAALAAADAGLDVILIDDAPKAGGQIYRAPAPALAEPAKVSDPDTVVGERLRGTLAASNVRFFPDVRVWTIGERFRVDAVGPDGPCMFSAPRLIAATGAHERIVPFPGWTLPGVMGLAAATILLKSEAMLPGRRIVIAGCGPLLAAVAAKTVAAKGQLAGIVDLSSRREWLRCLPALASRPDLLRRGAGWMLSLIRRRVPLHFASTISRVDEISGRLRVEIARVDSARRHVPREPVILDAIDAVVVGHGLVPAADVTRLAGAEHVYDRMRGGWVPQLDPMGRTSIDGLYAAGDGYGIRGGLPAAIAGELAGLATAEDMGRGNFSRIRQALAEARRLLRFSDAVSGVLALRPGQVADIAPETVVCRCEDVTRAEIEAALDDGAGDVNQLKHFTRCGMGPCQGRMCGDVVAELVAARTGSRSAAGLWTARPPLRPVAIGDLVGTFDYSDIPIPAPAPL